VLVEADANQLEVVAAAYLSQDSVLCEEIRNRVDLHTNNQKRFNLPDRLIAKKFQFRLLYGGSCWAYAYDREFNWISDDPKYWQKIIDEYYAKYAGVQAWHEQIVRTVEQTGRLVMPTGRVYEYQPYLKRGEYVWPRTTILNYPVQGLGHDLMAIARVVAFKRLKPVDPRILFVNSVHDSIILDIPDELCYTCCSTLEKVFEDIPINFRRQFGVNFNLPMRAECKYGPNWGALQEFKG
jgi:DNA polymerase I-like protein with 3'-5' exonuclease and polymerase domains